MAKATLYDPVTGKPRVVEVGSSEASDLQSKGYGLNAVEPLPKDPYSMDFLGGLSDRLGAGEAAQAYTKAREDYRNKFLQQNAFAEALKNTLAEADTESINLKSQRRDILEQAGNTPDQLRNELIAQGVTDPFARQQLINQRYNAQISQAGDLQDLIERKGVTMQDLLAKGGAAYETDLQAQQFDLESLLGQKEQEQTLLLDWVEQQRQLATEQRALEQAKELYKFEQANKTFAPKDDDDDDDDGTLLDQFKEDVENGMDEATARELYSEFAYSGGPIDQKFKGDESDLDKITDWASGGQSDVGPTNQSLLDLLSGYNPYRPKK